MRVRLEKRMSFSRSLTSLEICRQMAAALKYIDLERQAAATRIVIQHVLQRRVGDETAVPVVFAVDLDRWKTGRQRAARHHMLRANGGFRAVEIGEAAGAHIHRSDAEAGALGIVDAVEVDELFERLLERRRAVEARRHGRREPLMMRARSETGLAKHDRGNSADRSLPGGNRPGCR